MPASGPNKPHDVLRYGVSNFAAIGMTQRRSPPSEHFCRGRSVRGRGPQRHDLDRQGRRPPRCRRRSTRRHQLHRAGPSRLRERQPHSPHAERYREIDPLIGLIDEHVNVASPGLAYPLSITANLPEASVAVVGKSAGSQHGLVHRVRVCNRHRPPTSTIELSRSR